MKRGFTLIELLVVISIIGVLSSIVMGSLNNARIRARDVKATAELRQMELAAEFDYEDYGSYAPDVGPGTNPRFYGLYLHSFDASYYCSTCLYDWQNWGPTCIMVDLYQDYYGPVLKRRCIYTPGCVCTNS